MADKGIPQTEAEINIFLQTLDIKLPAYETILAITTEELEDLKNDAQNFDNMLVTTQRIIDSKDAFFEFKENLFKGEPSTVALTPPVFPLISPPQPALPGIIRRLRNLVKRIKTAPGYTIQIGEDLGLVESDPAGFNPDTLTAELKVRAISNGRVEISFSKQGMDAMRVEFKRKGETTWTLAGIFTASPGVHDEASVPPGSPEVREYRGFLVKKNEIVGNASPSYTVVTTP